MGQWGSHIVSKTALNKSQLLNFQVPTSSHIQRATNNKKLAKKTKLKVAQLKKKKEEDSGEPSIAFIWLLPCPRL